MLTPPPPRLERWQALCALDGFPTLIRIKARDLARQRCRRVSEVLLVDDAVMAHDEALDARHTVFRRISNQREPANHLAFHDVAQCPALSVRALRLDLKTVV